MVIAAQTPVLTVDRRGQSSLLALGGLGLLMIVFVAAAPWILRTYDYAVLVPAIALSGVITIAATALAPSVPERWGLILIVAMAIVMRLLVVGQEPFLSTDIYRYVWDGRVQAAGINPYAFVPADDALKSLRDATIYPNINRADYAVTAYPPVAQMFFLAVTRISETLTAMRLAMVACEIAVVAVLIDLASSHKPSRDRRRRLGLASARDLGNRQQRACRCPDGGAADDRCLAAGSQP